MRHGQLGSDKEVDQLRRLGMILASQNFSKLSRILVRLDFDQHYAHGPHSRPEDDQRFERNTNHSLNVIYDAFPVARARGILGVENLAYERRLVGQDIICITDNCLSPEFPTA
jgi:hypothetical protein